METALKNADRLGRLTNAELLRKFLGSRHSKRLYRRRLGSLFSGDPKPGTPEEKCALARELIKRWLSEELRKTTALSSPMAVRDYLRLTLRDRDHEVFAGVFLDAQNRVICVEELFRGTLTQTSVYPREVVKWALRTNAAGIIFAHNHPSGVAEPSRSDELLTQNLKQALALVDVKVLDHFIVAGASAMSFAERGIL